MTRIACIAGARPNFMKVKPVLDALEAVGATTSLVHTGQHYHPAMSDVFFEDIGIREPDHSLGVGSGTHAEQTARVMTSFEAVLPDINPDVVVVVGDVNSSLACALVAAKAGVYVAHVEAGLRSRDWTMPEEINRVVTDRLSDWLFAPSQEAVDNLNREGYRSDQVHLVGNVMIDTLLTNLERAQARPVLVSLGLKAGSYCLVTLHRPANVDNPGVLDGLLTCMRQIGERVPVVFPVHPRTRRQLTGRDLPGVMLIEPQGYLDFVALEANAAVVLTDSGGVQEETTVLGVPCLTARTSTERPITVTEGTNQVVGTHGPSVVAAVDRERTSPPPARKPALRDGRAGQRNPAQLTADSPPSRPTDVVT